LLLAAPIALLLAHPAAAGTLVYSRVPSSLPPPLSVVQVQEEKVKGGRKQYRQKQARRKPKFKR
jgi:hypothetical protein